MLEHVQNCLVERFKNGPFKKNLKDVRTEEIFLGVLFLIVLLGNFVRVRTSKIENNT